MIKIVGEKLKQYEKNRQVYIVLRKGFNPRKLCFIKSGIVYAVSAEENDGTLTANIPDALLMSHGTIMVYLEGIDDDGHKVTESQSFTIHRNVRPDDYTEPEIDMSGDGNIKVSWNDLEGKPFGELEYEPIAVLKGSSGVDDSYVFTAEFNADAVMDKHKDEFEIVTKLYKKANCIFVNNKYYWGVYGEKAILYKCFIDFKYDEIFQLEAVDDESEYPLFDFLNETWQDPYAYGNCTVKVYKYDEYGTKTLDSKYIPKATAVSDAASEAPTAEEFNALLASLRSAGYLATE